MKKPTVKSLKKKLEKISHDFIRRRDSIDDTEIKGYCFDCGLYSEGQQFQCGHFEPSGSSGALLRYHPQNMHGQSGACNIWYVQEKVKINYTMAMLKKYGKKRVDEIRRLKQRIIKADSIFYTNLIELYTIGDSDRIIEYLESL